MQKAGGFKQRADGLKKIDAYFSKKAKQEDIRTDKDSSSATNKISKENNTPISIISKLTNCDLISNSLARSDCSKETNAVDDPINKDLSKATNICQKQQI